MDFRASKDIRTEPNIREGSDPGAYIDVTVQSQYAASPAITRLARGFASLATPQDDMDLFYASIFNLLTAQGWGLDNWGRILGMGRYLEYPGDDCFGYQYSGLQPLDQAPFYSPGSVSTLRLDDTSYRQLLLWKALANISAADAASLNALMEQMFRIFGEDDPIFVIEVGIMRIRLVVEFAISSQMMAAIMQYGLLAKGAAVGLEYLVAPAPCFGFAGSGLHGFDQGIMWDGDILYHQPKI